MRHLHLSLLSFALLILTTGPGFIQKARADDPLGIVGTYLFPVVNGQDPNGKVQFVVDGTMSYKIIVVDNFTVPATGSVQGCNALSGDIVGMLEVDTLTTGYYSPFSYDFDANVAGRNDDHCRLDQFSGQNVLISVQGDGGVFIDVIDPSGTDQLYRKYVAVPTATPTSPPATDHQAPVAKAKKASGRQGQKIKLMYTVQENNGRTADKIEVLLSGKIVKTIRVVMSSKVSGVSYYVFWKAPAKSAGKKYSFKVVSTDPSGNVSKASSAKITVTK